jgi:hypothetical protein
LWPHGELAWRRSLPLPHSDSPRPTHAGASLTPPLPDGTVSPSLAADRDAPATGRLLPRRGSVQLARIRAPPAGASRQVAVITWCRLGPDQRNTPLFRPDSLSCPESGTTRTRGAPGPRSIASSAHAITAIRPPAAAAEHPPRTGSHGAPSAAPPRHHGSLPPSPACCSAAKPAAARPQDRASRARSASLVPRVCVQVAGSRQLEEVEERRCARKDDLMGLNCGPHLAMPVPLRAVTPPCSRSARRGRNNLRRWAHRCLSAGVDLTQRRGRRRWPTRKRL